MTKPAKNDMYDRFGDIMYDQPAMYTWVDLNKVPLIDKHLYAAYMKSDLPVYMPWLEPSFARFNALARGGLLSSAKLAFLVQMLKNVYIDDYEIWELGVLNGTTARVLHETCPNDTMRLFDTFEGLANSGDEDLYKDGDFQGASMAQVQAFLPGAHIYAGRIPSTFRFIPNGTQIKFAHIDLDIYQPTLDALGEVYHRMIPGGIIVIDDYGNWSTPGVKKAVDEFFETKPETPVCQVTSQAFVIKRYVP